MVTFRQYFNLNVGMIGQVGGYVWAGNQYSKKLRFQNTHFSHHVALISLLVCIFIIFNVSTFYHGRAMAITQ